MAVKKKKDHKASLDYLEQFLLQHVYKNWEITSLSRKVRVTFVNRLVIFQLVL